jgi:hypothetical protein
MPLAGTFLALKTGISNAFNLQNAATPDLKATVLTNAIAAVVPSGIYIPLAPPSGAPLVPSGFAATQTQFKNAFSLNTAATPDTVSQGMASAIAALVPTIPPVGQLALQTQIKNALTLNLAATPDSVATIIATAIISYYTAAGVI